MDSGSKSVKSGVSGGQLIVGTSAVLIAIVLSFAFLEKQKKAGAATPQISRYGMIEDFALTDQHNQPFGIKDVQGKVWVANFIFTSCATECPLLSRRMQDVQETFLNDPRVELVSISVDPRTDSPERLAKYAKAFKAGDRWAFLTGDTKEIERLSTKGFMVTMPGDHPEASSIRRTRELLHSEKIAVVDQLGVVRYYANGMSPGAARDITSVVRKLLESGS